MKTTLVIMAAGLGSRFKGGIKQLEGIGMYGETLMEFSIYDAIKAGFNKVVFVIREDFAADFKETIGKKIEKHVECEYVYQDLDNLPFPFAYQERLKPWGTGHAILITENVINEPFCVINADDYYGFTSFKKMYDYLINDINKDNYCMVGYLLENTLSTNGGVSRGICVVDLNDKLIEVNETHNIARVGNIILAGDTKLKEDMIVSMNMWGFHPSIFKYLKEEFEIFLNSLESDDMQSEFLLPNVVDKLVKNKKVSVQVLKTDDKWLGLTYKDDKNLVHEKIKELYKKGIYKNKLF